MRQKLADILRLFALEDADHLPDGTYLGPQPDDGVERVRVYGGQVAAQAIAAAARTVSGRRLRYVDPPPRISVDGAVPDDAVCRLWLRLVDCDPDENEAVGRC